MYGMKTLLKKVSSCSEEYGKVSAFIFLTLAILLVGYLCFEISSPKKLQVTFFDVGQGDAIFITTPSGKQVLIDGGGSNIILERVHTKLGYFDRSIDAIIATHGDMDHVTGLIPVLKEYDVSKIIVSPVPGDSGVFDVLDYEIQKEVQEGAQLHKAKKDDVITFHDGVVLTVLYPHASVSKNTDTNDASVVTLLTYGEHSFLLTGDLSKQYEPKLISNVLPKNVTVYKAGHHGSNTSSGELLLSRTKPEYSIISAGKENKYGHPHRETIERLQKYSKEIISTIERGSITFESDGRLLKVRTTR